MGVKGIKTEIEAQIAIVDKINCNFITLTKDGGKRILELLKKQEPILLENQHKPHGISTNANSPWISRCPRCDKKVEGKQTRFCKYCGQVMKWDE